MSVEIKLTVRFSFENGSAKPALMEIVDFVKSLDADPDQMIATYRIADEKSLFIKFKSEEAMQYCLSHNCEQLVFHYADGKAAKVRMSSAEDNIQYVRIYDLPPEIPDSNLMLVLGKYGEVKRTVREKFPVEVGLNQHTGVRGVYMNVKKQIPNSLHFLNRKGNIFYQGNKNLCFLCKMEGHLMNSCPNRKNPKQPVQQRNNEEAGTSSYAGVVTGEIGNANAEEMVEVLEEEVVEMDETPPEAAQRSGEETAGTNGEEATEKSGEEEGKAQKQQPRVFKYPNDAYYFYKFGIEDHTEKQRIKQEEEAKRLAIWREEKLKEAMELNARKKAGAKLQSPPRKSKKVVYK